MPKTLIIKTGASGDVVRTTALLRAIQGPIYWITSAYNQCLLPSLPELTTVAIEHVPLTWFAFRFDLLLNLEEDQETAVLAGRFKTDRYVGVYFDGRRLGYTPESRPWFDMSLLSRFGPVEANALKQSNRHSYQEFLFAMIGKTFQGERYHIAKPAATPLHQPLIGIERHAGSRWPNKHWFGYDALQELLHQQGFETYLFSRRNELPSYLNDIARCTLVISGDTLAMHAALAYDIPVIALFNCTSPYEIFDYGILVKMVSPLLDVYYYVTTNDEAAKRAISVSDVFRAAVTLLRQQAAG